MDDKEYYNYISNTINNYNTSIDSDENNFESKITYISAGNIGLLLAFVADIGYDYQVFFIIGLTCLVFALVLNMFSYMIGKMRKKRAVGQFNDIIEGVKKVDNICAYIDDKNKSISKRIDYGNWSALLLMVLGIVFSAIFVIINLQ